MKLMALIKCNECSAAISETAQCCPACGFARTQPKTKKWLELLSTACGPLILSAAGTLLAYITFVHQTETQEAEKLQAMIESAVSNDKSKERTAVRLVSYLAKSNQLSTSFALSILGTVARNDDDEKLRTEIYDAIENLTEKGSLKLAMLDQYDQLEIYCLRAALTPAQYWRQVNLHRIEQFATDKALKYRAATKLLSLAEDVLSPQAVIDILLSEPIRVSDPDLIERTIPILCKAVRQRSNNNSDNDVVEFLQSVARQTVATNRDGLRSQVRLLLAGALVAKDPAAQASSLKEIARITVSNPDLNDDTEQLFDTIVQSTGDANLRQIVDTARNCLALEKQSSRKQS
jgi:hypothetical protein